jgi:hypothetical protein
LNPNIQILNNFCLIFNLCKADFEFLYEKKFKKSLLEAKSFFEISLHGYKKNLEFYADFRSEEIIQKNLPKKDNPEKLFSKKNLPKSLEKMFFGVKLFLVLFLNNFSRAVFGMKFWTLDARIDLFQTIFFALRRD